MSCEEDSDAFDNFINEQNSKVKKRYISYAELANLDDMENFIADSDSESYESGDKNSETCSKSMDSIINGGTSSFKNKSIRISKLKKRSVSSTFQKSYSSEDYENEAKENILNIDPSCSKDGINVILNTPSKPSVNNKNDSNFSSPLFSDISFSDRSVLSDIGTDFIIPKVHIRNFKYDCFTLPPKPTDKTHINDYSKLPPLKTNMFFTPKSKLPMNKIKTVPTKLGQLSRLKSVNNSNEECDYSFIDDNSKLDLDSLSQSEDDDEHSDIFTESDEFPQSSSTKLFTPTLTSKKPLYQLSRTVPAKLNIKTLDFVSSLLDNVDEKERDCDAARFRKSFKNLKAELALKIYVIYNEKVFLNKLPHDIDIKWYPRLSKTAGRCRLSYTNKVPIEHRISIELSTKVLTDAERLLKTLVHEMCHGAAWMINKCNDVHGPIWKTWTYEAQRVFPRLPVSSRCHSYQIQYKYEYWCLTCNKAIKRHSKSLDTTRKVCGKCRGKFVLFVNQANGTKKKVEDEAALTGFPRFVKENYKKYRSAGISHGEVMKILSGKYKEHSEGEDLSHLLTSLQITEDHHGAL